MWKATTPVIVITSGAVFCIQHWNFLILLPQLGCRETNIDRSPHNYVQFQVQQGCVPNECRWGNIVFTSWTWVNRIIQTIYPAGYLQVAPKVRRYVLMQRGIHTSRLFTDSIYRILHFPKNQPPEQVKQRSETNLLHCCVLYKEMEKFSEKWFWGEPGALYETTLTQTSMAPLNGESVPTLTYKCNQNWDSKQWNGTQYYHF